MQFFTSFVSTRGICSIALALPSSGDGRASAVAIQSSFGGAFIHHVDPGVILFWVPFRSGGASLTLVMSLPCLFFPTTCAPVRHCTPGSPG